LSTTSRHLHWETINVGLTLGLRTGAKALQVLGIGRSEAVRAEVIGGHFFAQGIEGATGCSGHRMTVRTSPPWCHKRGATGCSGHRMTLRAGEEISECRENLAELLGIADPLRIIFTKPLFRYEKLV
ncbi:MAG: hypothetical protein WA125_16420, partial [Desulfosporosinus sp.]